MNRRCMVRMILLASLSWNLAGCSQILGIEDLPPLQDSGSQPPRDSGSPTPIDAPSPVLPDGRPPADAPLVPPYDASSFQRRKQITISAARVEAPSTPGFLADFPVLFAVEDPEIAARARADGSDIYFTDAAGGALAHEIEKWDPGTGALVAWVKLPRVSGTEDTVLFVHYGDPGAAPAPAPAEVWSNGFVAVWHLSQSPGPGGAGEIRDSTTGNDGTAHSSMQATDLVAAQIGDGIDFDGTDDQITFQNPITGPGPHTISVWVNQGGTSSEDALVVLGDGQTNRARFLHSVFLQGDVAFGFFNNDGTTNRDIVGRGWTLLHWTYENRDAGFYVNGDPLGTLRVNTGVDTQGSDGRLGNAAAAFGADMHLNGELDEVRIATVVRPTEWVRTEFNNQSNPAGFYTVGPESLP